MSLVDARINKNHWEQQAATLDVLGQLTQVFIEGLSTQANIDLANNSLKCLFQSGDGRVFHLHHSVHVLVS